MKKAAIDIGTNSVRLLLAEQQGQKLLRREKKLSMTRLGKGLQLTGELNQSSVVETLEALSRYLEEIRQNDYTLVGAIATSAVRDAKNAHILLEPARTHLALSIDVISGAEEARLGYLGAVKGFEFQKQEAVLLIDIGGGSTELILGIGNTLVQALSIDMGAVRMTEGFHSDQAPHFLNIEALTQSVHTSLAESGLKREDHKNIKGIGIGGTITTLGAMDLEMETYDAEKIQGFCLGLHQINQLITKMMTLTLEEKKKLSGLDPKRADIILSGAWILKIVLEYFGLDEIYVSDYDNLEGILFDES